MAYKSAKMPYVDTEEDSSSVSDSSSDSKDYSDSSSSSSSDSEDNSGSESEVLHPVTIKICEPCYKKIDKNVAKSVNMRLQRSGKEERCKICRAKANKSHADKLAPRERLRFLKSTMKKTAEASTPLLHCDKKRSSKKEDFRYLPATRKTEQAATHVPSEIANLTAFNSHSIAVLKDELKALLDQNFKKQSRNSRKLRRNAKEGSAEIAKLRSELETAVHKISDDTERNKAEISHLQSSVAELRISLEKNDCTMNQNNEELRAKMQKVAAEVSKKPNQGYVQVASQAPSTVYPQTGHLESLLSNIAELKRLVLRNESIMVQSNKELFARVQKVTDEVANAKGTNQGLGQGSIPASSQPTFADAERFRLQSEKLLSRNTFGGGQMGSAPTMVSSSALNPRHPPMVVPPPTMGYPPMMGRPPMMGSAPATMGPRPMPSFGLMGSSDPLRGPM